MSKKKKSLLYRLPVTNPLENKIRLLVFPEVQQSSQAKTIGAVMAGAGEQWRSKQSTLATILLPCRNTQARRKHRRKGLFEFTVPEDGAHSSHSRRSMSQRQELEAGLPHLHPLEGSRENSVLAYSRPSNSLQWDTPSSLAAPPKGAPLSPPSSTTNLD